MATESDTFRGVLLHSERTHSHGDVDDGAGARAWPHSDVWGGGAEADEGAVAHLWQILMAAQVPVLLFFALKWRQRAFSGSEGVLGVARRGT